MKKRAYCISLGRIQSKLNEMNEKCSLHKTDAIISEWAQPKNPFFNFCLALSPPTPIIPEIRTKSKS